MLKLNGKPLAAALPVALIVQRFLDKAPADELYTSRELALKIDGNADRIASSASRIPAKYHHIVSKDRLWGNPKAIVELRKQVAA